MRQNVVTEGQDTSVPIKQNDGRAPVKIEFPGQQTGERVFYRSKMAGSMKVLTMIAVVLISFGFLIMFQIAWSMFSPSLSGVEISNAVFPAFLVVDLITTLLILWWTNRVYSQTEIFITDRRIIKFLPLVPYRTSARALFWEEAIKVKTFYKNVILDKILGIGSIGVHGRNHEIDNIEMDYLTYHEDLGNYIDKILYTYKNKPDDLQIFKEFVPRPVGMRG